MTISFQSSPDDYRHWRLSVHGSRAALEMDVDEDGGLFPDYRLKLNSYDLGVDIELFDALQRIRFEHPQVKTVTIRSGKERVFCAGANISMLAGASHGHKVNFCKFTNETRNFMEQMSRHSGIKFIAAISGACAGGGYELALACDQILLTDDGSSSVSLPEVPLLGVLPGTGGLTRLTDKRKVRRDRADIFASTEEGIKGSRAAEWNLVDTVAVNSEFEGSLSRMVDTLNAQSDRPDQAQGITLKPLVKVETGNSLQYSGISLAIDRAGATAAITIQGPEESPPTGSDGLQPLGDQAWPLRTARELDDCLLHLRFNEPELGIIVFRTRGNPELVLAWDEFLAAHASHWLCREIIQQWSLVLKRLDLTSRSLVALVEPGSCFAGTLAEIVFASDRSFVAEGKFEDLPGDEAAITLSRANFGRYTMSNGITRLQTRFLGEPKKIDEAHSRIGEALDAQAAADLGLVSFAYDDIDWKDEIRIFLEERASFSADALTAMEANLRFAGPETMETKIFGRLTAWQNWVFQRPNAVGEKGALPSYGTGQKPVFDQRRI